MTKQDNLKKAIENLSQKSHVISDNALQARSNYTQGNNAIIKQQFLLSEFNRSIRILMGVFRDSNFDKMLVLASKPFQLFILNFILGLLKGAGAMVGILMVILFILYSFKEFIPDTFFIQLHSLLMSLKS